MVGQQPPQPVQVAAPDGLDHGDGQRVLRVEGHAASSVGTWAV
jgi:hypothetical protein